MIMPIDSLFDVIPYSTYFRIREAAPATNCVVAVGTRNRGNDSCGRTTRVPWAGRSISEFVPSLQFVLPSMAFRQKNDGRSGISTSPELRTPFQAALRYYYSCMYAFIRLATFLADTYHRCFKRASRDMTWKE